MNFTFKKESSIDIGDKFYAIVESSSRTYGGVYEAVVDYIDFGSNEVILKIDQPCKYIRAGFSEIGDYVFATQEEAQKVQHTLVDGAGLSSY